MGMKNYFITGYTSPEDESLFPEDESVTPEEDIENED